MNQNQHEIPIQPVENPILCNPYEDRMYIKYLFLNLEVALYE